MSSLNIMNDNLKCLICPYKAPRIERLRCHMQVTHQGLRVACKLCDHTFTNSSNLNKHTRNKHDGVKFSCKYCERVYTENQTLNRHIDIEHMNKEREIFSCAECKKEFLSKFYLLRHIKTHRGISLYALPAATVFFYLSQKELKAVRTEAEV